MFALKHLPGPPDAGFLAEAIRLIGPEGRLRGLRGLVRALLYRGTDYKTYIIKHILRNASGDGEERYNRIC